MVLASACSSLPSETKRAICPNCRTLHLTTPQQVTLASWTSDSVIRSDVLHVYLEGDGKPWVRGRLHATNPTSSRMLALQLMQADPYPSVYLNRPCYGFDSVPDYCDSTLWTSARYSDFVVKQLNEGITQLKHRYKARKVVLIGHSGGGSLAILIAHQRDDIAGILTVAANLDHKAWTDYFGYQPLFASANPADILPLPSSIPRWHLLGVKDSQVPIKVALPGARQDVHATVKVIDDYNHHCCWKREWSEKIERFRQAILPGHG